MEDVCIFLNVTKIPNPRKINEIERKTFSTFYTPKLCQIKAIISKIIQLLMQPVEDFDHHKDKLISSVSIRVTIPLFLKLEVCLSHWLLLPSCT
jgi:hypothetical protein